MAIKRSAGDIVADVCIYIFVGILSAICLIPFLHVASVSLSGDVPVYSKQVFLLPKELTLNAYRLVVGDKSMMTSLRFTVIITAGAVISGLFVTVCGAYALSKKRLKGGRFFSVVFLITMYFGAGAIPDYLLYENLNMLDTVWVLIIPIAFSAYNIIILRTFMQNSIPDSLIEAAHLDGCDEFRTLLQIVLPLSVPVLATLALFYAVGRWNGFSDALYYIKTDTLRPLQLKLYNLINATGSTESLESDGGVPQQAQEVVKAATIMFATLPIIIVYPFIQRYFVKGVMIGAVKE